MRNKLIYLDSVPLDLNDPKDRRLVSAVTQESSAQFWVFLINFRIPASTLSYSSDLIEARERVDRVFSEGVSELKLNIQPGEVLLTFDSTGFSVDGPLASSIDVFEYLDYLHARKLYKTLELGCCRTYSHHVFKTNCLVCVAVYRGKQNGAESLKARLLDYFESHYTE
jgi:hypothetical protein